MRRDLLYLAAVVANAALMVWSGYAILLAALGPAWLLRRGPLRPVWTAPLALIALAVLVPLVLDAFGADCPVEGMDYLEQCNGLAKVAMMFLYGGAIALELSVVATVYACVIRAGRALLGR